MPSRYHGILFILCLAGASFPPVGRWCSVWRTLSSVSVLLTSPEITHQWSLLGLNLWPNHAADKPPSNELLERDATRFPRGERIANDVEKWKKADVKGFSLTNFKNSKYDAADGDRMRTFNIAD